MSAGLDELRQRKRDLMVESEINREILRVEFAQLGIKAAQWKQGLFKAQKAYNVMAPLAGAGLALLMVRKHMYKKPKWKREDENGKPAYFAMLAPLGLAALRKGLSLWRQAQARHETIN